MNSPLLARVFLAAALAAVVSESVAAAKGAKEAKAAAVPNKKPELRLDLSPISAGKSAVVTSYADVVEPVQRAVVSIYSTKIIKERVQVNPLFRQFFPGLQDQERESKQEGMGSGVIVSADGYILTNHHVVEGADELCRAIDGSLCVADLAFECPAGTALTQSPEPRRRAAPPSRGQDREKDHRIHDFASNSASV